MKEIKTYNVGPVDLYELPFSISIGDLNPDFRLSEAYYQNGNIEASWIDGLGRKNRNGPVAINELGLASIFKSEKIEKAKEIFTCRNEHQKSLATWIFVSWKGNFSYLIVRKNKHNENYVLELLSTDSGYTDLSFSNMNELIDKLADHFIIKPVPSVIIKDLLIFVKNILGTEKDFSKLQFNNEVIMLSRDKKVIQISSYEKSGLAYIRSWELPQYGLFKVPKIIREQIEFFRLNDRIAYYRKSGYSEQTPFI